MSAPLGSVYLLHFAKPIGNPDAPTGQAQHYIGYAGPGRLTARVAEDIAGGPAAPKIMQHVARLGIAVELARVWEGNRARERQLKRMGGARRRCPLCGVKPKPDAPRPRPSRRPPFWPEPGAPPRPRELAAVPAWALADPPF